MKAKRNKIFTVSFWRVVGYFIIYSVLGFAVETVYGFVTKGVWESRQSFLYGPFCGIYGLGALVLMFCLKPFKKNKITLFFGGFIVGSVVEYLMSFAGEVLFNVKWWDYSGVPLNLNGRICVQFSVFWGALGIILIDYLNPAIDRAVELAQRRVPAKWFKTAEMVICLFLIFDISATVVALKLFYVRMVAEYDLKVANQAVFEKGYQVIYGNEKRASFVCRYFGNEKMLKTFPNLKLENTDGEIIYFEDLLSDTAED